MFAMASDGFDAAVKLLGHSTDDRDPDAEMFGGRKLLAVQQYRRSLNCGRIPGLELVLVDASVRCSLMEPFHALEM